MSNKNRAQFRVTAAPGLSGNFACGAALSKRRALGAADNGLAFDVVIEDGAAWEVRIGCTYTHATLTLTRGTLEDSSTGAAIALSASAVVSTTITAGYLAGVDAALPTTGEKSALTAMTSAGVQALTAGDVAAVRAVTGSVRAKRLAVVATKEFVVLLNPSPNLYRLCRLKAKNLCQHRGWELIHGFVVICNRLIEV